MRIAQPDWITEIYETGPSSVEFLTSYEKTRKPERRFRLTAGRLLGDAADGKYSAALERESEIQVGGRKLRVWEIVDQVPLGSGTTAEACFAQTFLFLRPEEVL